MALENARALHFSQLCAALVRDVAKQENQARSEKRHREVLALDPTRLRLMVILNRAFHPFLLLDSLRCTPPHPLLCSDIGLDCDVWGEY